jgi:hypothetical protein
MLGDRLAPTCESRFSFTPLSAEPESELGTCAHAAWILSEFAETNSATLLGVICHFPHVQVGYLIALLPVSNYRRWK